MTTPRITIATITCVFTGLLTCLALSPSTLWSGEGTLGERFAPPIGFHRAEVAPDSFAAWLRQLPLLPGRPPVKLFDGRNKGNQQAHLAVVDVSVSDRDLQQCADAVIRLRTEYLFAQGHEERIAFRFTSGDLASWPDWRSGQRPRIDGQRVTWQAKARPDHSYENLQRYLRTVFTYAGTASLERELELVSRPSQIEAGDVFVQGGFPGHAVLVADVVENDNGERRFLLVQSFMPAQQIHVLRNPQAPGSPWYEARDSGDLQTPEWPFDYTDLRRFPDR